MAQAIRDPAVLRERLGLAPATPEDKAAALSFPLLVPEGFLARMRPGDPTDPLLRQVLPEGAEMAPQPPGFSDDPLAEADCSLVPGLLRKYKGRALLVTTGACAVHCRYCFRRHFPYGDLPRGRAWWTKAVEELAKDQEIHEVLLSGGDPLTLPDSQLSSLANDLATLPQVVRLRIHSRLPIVIPERINAEFLTWFAQPRWQAVLVVHANHPQEIDKGVQAALARCRQAGITVLNQSVLLRGVNDSVAVLAALSERLFAAGALPYYVHALDAVRGAGHFAVDDATAKALQRDLAATLPGYLVPRFVREIPGEPNKTPL